MSVALSQGYNVKEIEPLKKKASMAIEIIFFAMMFLMLLGAVCFNLMYYSTTHQLSQHQFEEQKERLQRISTYYIEDVKESCRQSVDQNQPNAKVIDDYIVIRSENGRMTFSYYWENSDGTAYSAPAYGDDEDVAMAIWEDRPVEATAYYDGSVITMSVTR